MTRNNRTGDQEFESPNLSTNLHDRLKKVRETLLGISPSGYLRSSVALFGLNVVVMATLGLCSQAMLTRNLTLEQYGRLAWVHTVVATFSFLSLPALSQSLVSAVSRGYDGNYRIVFRDRLISSLVGSACIFLAALYYQTHESPQLSKCLMVAAVLSVGVWMNLQDAFWNGKHSFRKMVVYSIAVKTTEVLVLATVLRASRSLVVVLLVQLGVSSLANLTASIILLRKYRHADSTSPEFISYGRYMSLLGIASLAASQTDKWATKLVGGYGDLAMYSIGQLLYTYFLKTPAGIMANVFQPRLAVMTREDAARWLLSRQPLVFFIVLVPVVLAAACLPVVYPLVFSDKYAGGLYYAYGFLACVVVSSPQILVGTFLKAHILRRQSLITQVLTSATPFLAIPFGLLYGPRGVVWSKFVGLSLLSCWYLFMLYGLTSPAEE
jgi:O-antigen/teichoic acid export membrane protein